MTYLGIPAFRHFHKDSLIGYTEKHPNVKKAFTGEVTPLCPASILRLHPCFTIIIDKAAATLCLPELARYI